MYYAGLPETHFLKYPLLSQKQVDFFLFKAVVELVNANEHLTLLGLQKIVNIKASLNKGLPESLKEAFPNWSPVSKPTLQVTEIQDPNWLTGFVNGDGSFHVTIAKSKTNITGYAIRLQFNIGQHSRDFKLLSSFNNYLNCGFVTLNAKLPNCSFTVTKFSDAVNIIIPFYFVFFQKKKRKKDILWRVQKNKILWIDVELRS